jgi:hypothetical protein
MPGDVPFNVLFSAPELGEIDPAEAYLNTPAPAVSAYSAAATPRQGEPFRPWSCYGRRNQHRRAALEELG